MGDFEEPDDKARWGDTTSPYDDHESCHIPNCNEPAAGDCDPCGKPTCEEHLTHHDQHNNIGIETDQCAVCACNVDPDTGEEVTDIHERMRLADAQWGVRR